MKPAFLRAAMLDCRESMGPRSPHRSPCDVATASFRHGQEASRRGTPGTGPGQDHQLARPRTEGEDGGLAPRTPAILTAADLR